MGLPADESRRGLTIRFVLIIVLSAITAVLTHLAGLTGQQVTATTVFLFIVMGTLFFWSFRLAVAFLGASMLLLLNVFETRDFVGHSALEVILFLVGMMIVVGALRDLGFFTWVVQSISGLKGLTARRFMIITMVVSALLAGAVDEVTSMLFMAVLVFQVCETLKVNPTPFLIMSVLATNIGSSGTMMGNPVGVFIGTEGGLSFEAFMIWAFPVMLVCLVAAIPVVLFWYRKDLDLFEERLRERREKGLGLAPRVRVPYKRGLIVLGGTMLLIACHHRVEKALGLEPSTMLLVAPLMAAGVIMIWRRKRARHYVEADVDWWTLLFFLILFGVAGALEQTGVTERMAGWFESHSGDNMPLTVAMITFITGIGSAFVDNVVFVAAFAPVVKVLGERLGHAMPLWWALLFGACYGGNITMIGSTANIVALGMLEKRSRVQIRFFEWLKVGAMVGVMTMAIAAGAVMLLHPLMPKGDGTTHATADETAVDVADVEGSAPLPLPQRELLPAGQAPHPPQARHRQE